MNKIMEEIFLILNRKKYFIKPLYQINYNPDIFKDIPIDGIIHQENVYKIAAYLAEMKSCMHVIDVGIGNGLKIVRYFSEYDIVGVDCHNNLSVDESDNKKILFISCDLNKHKPDIAENILKDSIVICSDVIEHLVNPSILLEWLHDISDVVKLIIISTPERDLVRGYETFGPPENSAHVREWNLAEFNNLLVSYKISPTFIGLTINNNVDRDKKTIIAIHDPIVTCSKQNIRDINVQAIMPTYNEADIVRQTIGYLVAQNIHVHCIDNWSKDGTFEVIESLAKSSPLVSYERFPAGGPSATYDWFDILKRIEENATKELKADWYIFQDADEIRESPFARPGNLKDAIALVDAAGFNAVDFTLINFVPTKDGFDEKCNVGKFFTHFEFGKRSGHFKQVKAWKSAAVIDLANSGGHHVKFSGQKIFPYKFLLKHFPFRSQRQAEEKVFVHRKPRWNQGEKAKGWHTHYDEIKNGESFIKDQRRHLKYDQVGFSYQYLVERLTGIGILDD